MKIQPNYLSMNQPKKTNPSFQGGAYIPRNYKVARELADAVYDSTGGMGKFLMYLQKHSGENLNNTITAIGTTGVAPFFIAFNPFSKEDKDSKYYTALRQPISACIQLATQLFVMTNYNKWLDKHAAFLGIDEMDLQAKPPKTVILSQAKGDYAKYYSECVKSGVEPVKKQTWITSRVREIQDNAFYDTLSKMRENADNLNIKTEDVVKVDLLNEKRKECFKRILKDDFAFSDAELDTIKDYNEFLKKKGKKFCDAKLLDHKLVKAAVETESMKLAVADLDKIVDLEANVKLKTSLYKLEMQEQFSKELLHLKNKKIANDTRTPVEKLQDATTIIKNKVYHSLLRKLKPEYDAIMSKAPEQLTDNETISKLVYEKLLKHADEPIDGLKNHGSDFDKVRKSVMIKKALVNRINKSETKLKGWKDRSGIIVGLLILPATCGLLNWAYPKVMKKYFPKLSEAKAEAKAKAYGLDVKEKEAK